MFDWSTRHILGTEIIMGQLWPIKRESEAKDPSIETNKSNEKSTSKEKK